MVTQYRRLVKEIETKCQKASALIYRLWLLSCSQYQHGNHISILIPALCYQCQTKSKQATREGDHNTHVGMSEKGYQFKQKIQIERLRQRICWSCNACWLHGRAEHKDISSSNKNGVWSTHVCTQLITGYRPLGRPTNRWIYKTQILRYSHVNQRTILAITTFS